MTLPLMVDTRISKVRPAPSLLTGELRYRPACQFRQPPPDNGAFYANGHARGNHGFHQPRHYHAAVVGLCNARLMAGIIYVDFAFQWESHYDANYTSPIILWLSRSSQ